MWNAITGQELRTLKGSLTSVCFSPDGERLACASSDGTVKVLDAVTGRELLTLKGRTRWVTDVCFSPDNKRLAGVSWGQAQLWDAVTGQELYMRGNTSFVHSVCFSPDGKYLASAGDDQMVKLLDLTGQEFITLKGHTDIVSSVCFSPDGKRLASAGFDGTVKVWDAATRQEPFITFLGGGIFSPDGKCIASTNDPIQTVKLWDAVTGQTLLTLKGHSGVVTHLCFSLDSKRLASVGFFDTPRASLVKVWDRANGQELLTLKGLSPVNSVCFSPDSKRLACASSDRTVKVWDVATGQELLTLKGHMGVMGVMSVCFSPDGKRLASGSGDATVKLWDATTGQELLTLKGHTNGVISVCFSSDGKRLASGSADATVKLWDAATGQELLTLKGHTKIVNSVCFSPDGKRLASGSGDATVKLWNATTGQELLTLKGHTNGVISVCFSSDGKRLATTGDGVLKLWEGATGQDRVLHGPTAAIAHVSFSADSTRIIAQSEKGEVCSWNVKTGREIVPCADPPPTNGKESLSPDRTLRVKAEGLSVRVEQVGDDRQSSELVFAQQLNDLRSRLQWHRREAEEAERFGQWFAASHHLSQLLLMADPEDKSAALRVRRLRVLTLLQIQPSDVIKLRVAILQRPVDKAGPLEQELADIYHALESSRLTYGCLIGFDAQPAMLRDFCTAEERLLRDLPSPTLLEGEKLTVHAKSGNFGLFPQDMRSWSAEHWSGNAQLFANPTIKGTWTDLEVPVPSDGLYLLTAHMTRASDYGIVHFSIAGKMLGDPFDGYQPEVVGPVPVSLGRVELKKGTTLLRIETVDANPKARPNHYSWGLDCLVLTPVK